MQLFPVGKVYDFMGPRRYFIGASALIVLLSIIVLWYPGPRLGTDFVGGTELEIAFKKPVTTLQIQAAVEKAGVSRPEVIRVEDSKSPHHYLLRVQDVSTIPEAAQRAIETKLCFGETKPEGCTHHATEVKFSPGGEKIAVRFQDTPNLEFVEAAVSGRASTTRSFRTRAIIESRCSSPASVSE
jgi:preprotein translocase subunit SecF